MILPQAIYTRNEIPNADYLMSFQEALTEEFLTGAKTLKDAAINYGKSSLDRRRGGIALDETAYLITSKMPGTDSYKTNLNGWLSVLFKYNRGEDNSPLNFSMQSTDGRSQRFKTAYNLVKEFGEHCPIAQYSILAPNTVLGRHTGPENRTGKYIRIHIPLIVPIGDVFLEVNGEEVTWHDIFGFNNQFVHSAHNYTDQYRLIFLIDLDREFIGMSPGEPWDERFEDLATQPFVRKKETK